jgi:hypothetical protein
MASGDFLDLSQAAVRAAQGDPTDTSGDLARGKAAINEAYLSTCHTGDPWDFLEKEGQWTTTAGDDTYTYAGIVTALSITGATIREIHKLTNDTDGGRPLLSMDWEGLETLSDSSQESAEGDGPPMAWSKWGSQGSPRLRLYPAPDAVYTMGTYCFLTPDELSADGDTPLIPLAWRHRVLVPYAAALLLEQEGGPEAFAGYDRLMARYETNFNRMRSALGTGKKPTFNVVQPGAFDDLPGSGFDWGVW